MMPQRIRLHHTKLGDFYIEELAKIRVFEFENERAALREHIYRLAPKTPSGGDAKIREPNEEEEKNRSSKRHRSRRRAGERKK